jgi:hypothetical protein
METNKKQKTSSEPKTEWSLIISLLSLGVALFGLCVAIFGAWYAYTSSKSSVTRQIIASFNSAAVTLPTASECFIFSNQVEEDRFYDLLGNRPTEFNFTAPAEDHLGRCLQITSPSKHVSAGDALKIRQIVFAKLNSFQEVYRSVALGEGYPQTLCQEVRTGFQSGPREFIHRARSKTPRPTLGQNVDNDLNFVVQVAEGKLCQS